ncbi:PilT/PilU family type 4a pilus ATPase [Neisseria brasiliensis]|uniref:PilT/PilU family type 4a pilus ATPase n=1 Tax=Neisseria TaxID=482 RepID=UPI000C276221|nr:MULTISPECIES: PilT/PilU family type 4a pilus ATPase [Neisseria]PJO79077.1 type IV pili twitching motility protein PilT [Neisseria sp. N177_16]QGL25152.1 PilT/PilU family type 4a pilus ATPase [Neisseria brasiliensis]
MSDNNPLHDLLSEMVQAYSQKNQAPHIPTPAEIGTHLHPLLDRMCVEAENRKASDIFISAGFPPSMKVSGVLTPVPHKALTGEETAQIVESTMNPEQLETFNREWELNYSVQSRSNTRYRVNAYHEQGRVGLVLRRINQEIPEMEVLGLPEKTKDLALAPRGLLILAGPTGSGKSTTMASMLNYRNNKIPGHVVTIEDPIEFIYKPRRCIFTQREIGIDTPDWKTAIQNAMRQAPDVVCIGEVRSAESMEYAMQLAQTGHLCVFTIHANSASQTIERIINFYPEERQKQVLMDLALNLTGIIGQRLAIKKNRTQRTAAIDLLLNTPAMQDLIFKGELMEIRGLMDRASGDGMQTFDQHLFNLYTQGHIEYDEALRQADSANDLRLRIQLHEEGNEPERLFDRISDLNLM